MIAPHIKELITSKGASVIRKMFEEGVALKKLHGEENVFDFSLGNPDLDPPEEVLSAIKDIAQDTSHGVHGYMPNAGYPEARAAMAEKTALEQGLPKGSVKAEHIVMTVGAASALNCVFKAILSPGDEVIVPAPFFAEYRHYVHNYAGILKEIPSKPDFSLDVEAIKAALSPKTAAVLINTPNNPTGKVYTESDITALTDALKAHAAACGRKPYLICDEPYRAIIYDGAVVSPVFLHYNESVIVTSFAKNLSVPGERIGYIAVNPACEDAAEFIAATTFALRVLGCVNAPAFFQKVIARTWNAPCDYSRYQKRRDMLMAVLDKAGIRYARPEGAFYLFCKVPDCFDNGSGDDMAFCDYLKQYFILSAPGSGFGGKGWFRLAYCVSEQTIAGSEKAFCAAMKSLNR
ncbi:MAG: pyridoxal phosphate-dependent aminotransferase [Treponema sp.]|nr:pyridoxal phosphate-dependent aminotransferase [Treponema sp.]